jgi:hypothetical protein
MKIVPVIAIVLLRASAVDALHMNRKHNHGGVSLPVGVTNAAPTRQPSGKAQSSNQGANNGGVNVAGAPSRTPSASKTARPWTATSDAPNSAPSPDSIISTGDEQSDAPTGAPIMGTATPSVTVDSTPDQVTENPSGVSVGDGSTDKPVTGNDDLQSDIPSLAPSDFPSVTPSIMPSLTPSIQTGLLASDLPSIVSGGFSSQPSSFSLQDGSGINDPNALESSEAFPPVSGSTKLLFGVTLFVMSWML